MVSEAIRTALLDQNSSENDRNAAFKCLEAWIAYFTAK